MSTIILLIVSLLMAALAIDDERPGFVNELEDFLRGTEDDR